MQQHEQNEIANASLVATKTYLKSMIGEVNPLHSLYYTLWHF